MARPKHTRPSGLVSDAAGASDAGHCHGQLARQIARAPLPPSRARPLPTRRQSLPAFRPHAQHGDLGGVGIGDEAAVEHVGRTGHMSVSAAEIIPPVQLSAVAMMQTAGRARPATRGPRSHQHPMRQPGRDKRAEARRTIPPRDRPASPPPHRSRGRRGRSPRVSRCRTAGRTQRPQPNRARPAGPSRRCRATRRRRTGNSSAIHWPATSSITISDGSSPGLSRNSSAQAQKPRPVTATVASTSSGKPSRWSITSPRITATADPQVPGAGRSSPCRKTWPDQPRHA
jgi:hypothetical protein